MLTEYEIEAVERDHALLERIAKALENLDRKPQAVCDYCQGDLDSGDFRNLCPEPDRVIAFSRFGKIHAYSPDDGFYSIKIHYCPMCGRKLGKEDA